MPRRGPVPRRQVPPDPIYRSEVVAKLINKVMLKGKKSLAERICYTAFDIIRAKTKREPLEVLEQALKNVMPVLEVKARRVGGANYQVPVEVRPERRQTLGIRWLVHYARERTGKSMAERLAAEIMDAAAGTGGAVKKKEDTHRMAEANRAFAHYRW
ncbi:MAG: 30S ribosomal protein S7 [Desulfotomaculales bacterium]